jgi:hypothetical protein
MANYIQKQINQIPTSFLNEMTAAYRRWTEITIKTQKEFGTEIVKELEAAGISTGRHFSNRTLLNASILSELKKNPSCKRDFLTVLTICAAMDFDIKKTEYYLNFCGHSFKQGDSKHKAYSDVIIILQGYSLEARNEYLDSVNVPRLGSHQRL